MGAEGGPDQSQLAVAPPKNDDESGIGQLESSFAAAEQNNQAARALLRMAQKMQKHDPVRFDSKEFRLISPRMQAGETLDDIIQKTAANVRGTRQEMFRQELPLRQAQADQLRAEIGDEVPDEDVLKVLEGIDKRHAIRMDTPAYRKVQELMFAGNKPDQIRQGIETRRVRHATAEKLLKIVRGMQNPTYARPLDAQLEQAIKDRVAQGETLPQIEAALRAEVEGPMKKQRDLVQTEQRVKELLWLTDGLIRPAGQGFDQNRQAQPVPDARTNPPAADGQPPQPLERNQPLPFVDTNRPFTTEAQSKVDQLLDELRRLNGELNSGYSSLQPQTVMEAINARQQGYAVKLNSPEHEFITSRQRQAQNLSQIKEQAEAAVREGHGIPLTSQERDSLRRRIHEIRLENGGISTNPNSYA